MTVRALVLIGLSLVSLAVWIARQERYAARAASSYPQDIGTIDFLLAGRLALETSVLESRAGLQLNFDAVDRAVLVLRRASQEANVVRGRGPAYGEAAEKLERMSEQLQVEETSLETFKTDLALLRLSSRYFPFAADALMQRVDGGSQPLRVLRAEIDRYKDDPSAQGAWRIGGALTTLDAARSALEARMAVIGELRTNVERYEESPTRDVAQRLEAAIPALDSLRATLDDAARADLDVLLGHIRAILDRRERVDRFARTLVRSPVRVHAEAARASYERAASEQLRLVLALRIAAAEIAVAAIVALGAAIWLAGRRNRRPARAG